MSAEASRATVGRRFAAAVIGGSAGSVDALGVMLPALPAGSAVAVAVVLHLPRERPSLLAEIFRTRCSLVVEEAVDKMPVAPGHVVFAPPDYHLLIDRGPRLALSIDAPVHYSRPSIDVLFESAADVFGDALIGIVLSGGNEDGARGLQAIRRAGGLAVVQDPDTAQVPAMPLAAIARGEVDHVLAPEAIAQLLATLTGRGDAR